MLAIQRIRPIRLTFGNASVLRCPGLEIRSRTPLPLNLDPARPPDFLQLKTPLPGLPSAPLPAQIMLCLRSKLHDVALFPLNRVKRR